MTTRTTSRSDQRIHDVRKEKPRLVGSNLVRTRTGFTGTARLVVHAPVLGRPEHVLLAAASRPEQTEQFHFFTVKPGGNIDFGPK